MRSLAVWNRITRQARRWLPDGFGLPDGCEIPSASGQGCETSFVRLWSRSRFARRERIATAKGAWRHTHPPSKEPTEVGGIFEAEVIGDLGDRDRSVAPLAFSLYERPQVHELNWRIARYCGTGTQEAALRRLQRGYVLADPDIVSEVLLHFLAKARIQLSVRILDARAGRARIGQ